MVVATIKFALETQKPDNAQSKKRDKIAQMSDDDSVHSFNSDRNLMA